MDVEAGAAIDQDYISVDGARGRFSSQLDSINSSGSIFGHIAATCALLHVRSVAMSLLPPAQRIIGIRK